ncbi:hypothetical protein [Streptomyces sp. NBC_00259]|uniref:hypothetical protein n=1 Tax=Streptomyces sp. NBC_00259 TaxID=2903643 RepID=UPI002E2D9112|nr:hypothetical protein [Streptomyces sp. NBC_00259]
MPEASREPRTAPAEVLPGASLAPSQLDEVLGNLGPHRAGTPVPADIRRTD